MTDTLTRPIPAAARTPLQNAAPRRRVAGARPRLFVGIAVALWTALLGLALPVCVTLSAWVTAAHHDNAVRPALAMAVQMWLVAHHTGLHLTGGSFSIVPLGLSMAFAALLMRAGRQAARLSGAHDRFDALTTGLSIALPYSVAAALLTRAGQSGQVRPAPLQAMAGAFTLALVFAVIGALRETDQLSGLARAVPADVRAVLRAALFATATVIGVGFVLVAVGLATHAERAAAFVGSLRGGIAAAALMAVASIAYLPNVVVWASALAVGPGFAVGTKTSVAFGGVHLGAVPALPLLAPLPSGGALPAVAWLAALAPVLAGLVAGRLVGRGQGERHEPISQIALRGLAAGGAVGLILGTLAWLSSGSLAPGRMARLGPSPWQVGLAAAVEIGLVAAATSALISWRYSQQTRTAEVPAPVAAEAAVMDEPLLTEPLLDETQG